MMLLYGIIGECENWFEEREELILWFDERFEERLDMSCNCYWGIRVFKSVKLDLHYM